MVSKEEYLAAKKLVDDYEKENLKVVEKPTGGRVYSTKVSNSYLISIEQWESYLDNGMIMDEDGVGYWAKDGFESKDDPFKTEQLDATHVAWYNK